MFIHRQLLDYLNSHYPPKGKAVVIFGARRVGKTTILRKLIGDRPFTWINGDASEEAKLISFPTSASALSFLKMSGNLVIDEAQHIPNFGQMLKILVDVNEIRPNPSKIYVTGSSSLDLAGNVHESAVGRFQAYRLFPISLSELGETIGIMNALLSLPERLLFGMYPGIITDPESPIQRLEELCDGVLFKDIFSLTGIRRSKEFAGLVQALAWSIGSEINYESIGRDCGLSKHTVASYIEMLEECFIVKECPSFARNHANEIKKGKKIYFCDVGIRNALINHFAPIQSRDDLGGLWENFFFMERLKWLNAYQPGTNLYFWRTKQPYSKEIDFVEEHNGQLTLFECKFSEKSHAKIPSSFVQAYGNCPFHVVNQKTIWEFIKPPEKAGARE